MTIGFWAIAAEDPHRIAVVDADGATASFGELLAASNRVAHGLRAAGLQPGDNVSIVLHNVPAFLELYLAAMQIGLYITPINFHLTGPGDVDVSTSVGGEGDESFEVTLAAGEYTFLCDPHASQMRGTFTVG